jgi:hypothetical protein
MHKWEKQVEPAVRAISTLHSEVLDDLDADNVDNGGIGWWQGMTSWRHLALLSDYLLQSLSGACSSLQYAAYAANEHRSVDAAMDLKLRSHWRKGFNPDKLLPERTDTDRTTEVRRAMTIEQVMYHLAQSLDRLAPAVLIVGAVNVRGVRELDWGALASTSRKLSLPSFEKNALKDAAYSTFAPAGSPGRAIQEALFEPLADLDRYGQPDWLTWLRQTRNAATHRAPGIQWHMLKGKRGAPTGFHRGLARNPKWTDIENLVRQPHDRRSLEAVVLAPSTPDVLDGLVSSTVKLAEALGASMLTCWQARRATPEVLTQPGRQWHDLEPKAPLRFMGDGPPVHLLLGEGATVHVGTELGRRIKAARILDGSDGRNAWERG